MSEKKRVITISGMPGSGKSTTAKLVAQALGFGHFSSGDFMREMARERGLSIEEISNLAKTDPTIDPIIDDRIREVGETQNDIVIDSRMAFHWLPSSFKVFLKIDAHIAAERMYNQIKTEGRVSQSASSLEEVEQKLMGRFEAEKERYKKYYNVDYTDESPYDLVIDSGVSEVAERTKLVLDGYNEWLIS